MSAGELVVHVFPARWGLPSVSPFCTKLETWLRLAKIPYRQNAALAPNGSPLGKKPFVILEDGRMIADSRQIIATLAAERGVTLDAHLSTRDRALGHSLQRMLEEHMYFVMLHERWLSADGWDVVKEAYFGELPPVVRQLAPPMLRRRVRRDVWGQGTGRLSAELMGQLAIEDVDAVADVLGDRPYVLGDRPSSVDAVAFAFIASWLWCPIPSVVKDRVEERAELVAYCDRLRLELMPEYAPGQ